MFHISRVAHRRRFTISPRIPAALITCIAAAFPTAAQIAPLFPEILHANGTDDSGDDSFPVAESDGLGNWVAVWYSTEDLDSAGADEDIFAASSSDNGLTWSNPVVLSRSSGVMDEADFLPTLATDGRGNWVVAWYSFENLNSADGDADIFGAVSDDNGVTWSGAFFVNVDAATDSGDDSRPALATDKRGNWVCVWQSREPIGGSGTDNDIVAATSTDNGVTWSMPALVNSNGTTDAGSDDDRPSVAMNVAGETVAAWSSPSDVDGSDGDSDILYATSANHGADWSEVHLLHASGTTDSGADLFVDVANDGNTTWLVAWQTDSDINQTDTDDDVFIVRSTDAGESWSLPRILNSFATTDTGDDIRPTLAADGRGNWVATWTSFDNFMGKGTDSDVVGAYSTDNGIHWSDAEFINSNAVGDPGSDGNASVATDSLGTWLAVWNSTSPIDGSETDDDILVTQFQFAPAPAMPAAAPYSLALCVFLFATAGGIVAGGARRAR